MKSDKVIPKSVDKALDKKIPSGKAVLPGISIRNGPVEEMDIDSPLQTNHQSNGVNNSKRKSRSSLGTGKTYKEDSSEDDEPLV